MAKGPREWQPKRPGGEKYVVALVNDKESIPVEDLEPEEAEEWGAEGFSAVTLYSAGVYPVNPVKEKDLSDEEGWEAFIQAVNQGEKEPLHRTDLYPYPNDALEEAKDWAEEHRFKVWQAISLY